MTSCERVFTSLSHREPDRVPLDIGGTTVTGIAVSALYRLLQSRHIDVPIEITDTVQQTAVPPVDVLSMMRVDTLRIGPDRIRKPNPPSVVDEFYVPWHMKQGELYYSQCGYPLGEGDSLSEALTRYDFPRPDSEYLRGVVSRGKGIRGDSCPILDRDCAGLMEMSARLRGHEKFYSDLYIDHTGVERLADLLFEYKLAYWKIVLDEWGMENVVVSEADDYGTDVSLLVSPNLLKEIYFPRYKQLFEAIKRWNPKAKIFFHSCGAIRPIIPDLIEAGVDILNPVQYSARGMELEGLKNDFGKDVVFWGGGIDTQKILPFGKPQEVRDEVKRVLDIMAPGGGFVFATVHNIQSDVPTENIEAMLETLFEYGRY
jgi:uroporphyrinogen decarboxylase